MILFFRNSEIDCDPVRNITDFTKSNQLVIKSVPPSIPLLSRVCSIILGDATTSAPNANAFTVSIGELIPPEPIKTNLNDFFNLLTSLKQCEVGIPQSHNSISF